VTLT
jgi:hypothetical protein